MNNTLRHKQLYSLFEIERLPNGRNKYTRISSLSFYREQAVRVFQNALLAPHLGAEPLKPRCLRPVK